MIEFKCLGTQELEGVELLSSTRLGFCAPYWNLKERHFQQNLKVWN